MPVMSETVMAFPPATLVISGCEQVLSFDIAVCGIPVSFGLPGLPVIRPREHAQVFPNDDVTSRVGEGEIRMHAALELGSNKWAFVAVTHISSFQHVCDNQL